MDAKELKNMELMQNLQKEFDTSEVKWRIGYKNGARTSALALAYLDSRTIQNRLDEVLGFENWKTEYKEIPQLGVICKLSVKVDGEWISKEDGAEFPFNNNGANGSDNPLKTAISSAFKRVASSGFGIGRYLYKAENIWWPIKQVGNNRYEFDGTPSLTQKPPYNNNYNNNNNGNMNNFGNGQNFQPQNQF